MARALKLKASGGGGFLNGVDATLVSYTFTDEFMDQPFEPGKFTYELRDKTGKKTGKKETKEKPHKLYARLEFLVDGAEQPVVQMRAVGDFDRWSIEDDGKTIRSAVDGGQISEGSQFGKFLLSVQEAGCDECLSDDVDEDAFNFAPLEGLRMRLIQKPDTEVQAQFGQQFNKEGKGFDRKYLAVEQVYGPATPQKAAGGVKAGVKANTAKVATNGSGRPLGGSKGKSAPVAEPEVDIEAVTAEALVAVVQRQKAKDGVHSLTKAKLGMPVMTDVRKAYPGEDQIGKDAYKLALDENFLKQELGWSYDHVTQMVSVEAA